MQKALKFVENLINAFMVVALSLMVILVFGNVIFRYVFNSGLNSSEELSRFLFVWLTFLGTILAFKDNEHLGVDTLVKYLPIRLKRMVLVFSQLLMLLVCSLIFQGSWKLTIINFHTKVPVTGMSLSLMYITGIIMSVTVALIILRNLYWLLSNKIDISELTMIKESEELTDIHQQDLGKDGKQT